MALTTLNIGTLRHRLTLSNPTSTPDGDGGFTVAYTELNPPNAYAAIRPMSGLERVAANTIVAQATHQVTLRYHPDVTAQTRVQFVDRSGRTRTLQVTDVTDLNEEGVMLQLMCIEVTGE